MATFPPPPAWVAAELFRGLVIPAHPLALTARRQLDERRQRGLTRYYHAAGAGGVAIAVHTTQFEIRKPKHNLLEPVLALASETIADLDRGSNRKMVRIAGACGKTTQAVAEADLARRHGFHAALVSLAALPSASDAALIRHCRHVAEVLPLIGFYLQPAVGGRVLSRNFWRHFLEIPNVIAVKVAPFNRYQTLDVILALAESGRSAEVALYTGNDDNVVVDLLTRHEVTTPAGKITVGFAGGLLGHWACWTSPAVRLLEQCKTARRKQQIPGGLLGLSSQITDCNAALFDAANGYAGCIPGIHEVLYRQGLLANNLCLNPRETLSPGQSKEIDRVCHAYPHLTDDAFVRDHLAEWLR